MKYLYVVMILFCSSLAPTWAQAQIPAGSSAPVPGSADIAAPAPKAPLKGSLKTHAVKAAEGLRQMGESLKKMQRAASELAGEATRQDYVSVGDPDVVGTIIIPAIPAPSGLLPIGDYLPMRQNWVDYYLDQIGKLLPIYAAEVDALRFPDSVKSDATALLEQMRPLFEDGKAHYLTLFNMQKDLSKTENMKLGEQAVMLYDDMKKLDDLRKKVFALLKGAE